MPQLHVWLSGKVGREHGKVIRDDCIELVVLPGLSNLWMVLIKATPLLFLLGVEDIVYWARELGGSKTSAFAYPHGDWRAAYFSGLLCFYLLLTWLSQMSFDRLHHRLSRGQAVHGASA